MKRLLYLAATSMVATLLFASMAAAQEDPCPDPAFPRETPDGCQASPLPDVPTPGSTVAEPTPEPTQPGAGGGQYATPPEVEPEATPEPESMLEEMPDDTGTLPDTGGPGLLLPVAGLLLGAGLVGLRVARK